MNAKQTIFRVRRNYNQWVNNQTLEDYALRFTAKSSRKWSLYRVANTALGAISFLALEAIGGAITLSYGFDNAAVAVLVVGALIFLAGVPICYYAAKYGVDIDLLTRGAGFGYIGSTATSLIYASFTFIFFALEAAIMAMALKLIFSIPLLVGYILCSVVVIPLVTHGITFISRFQLWTQPVWVLLQIIPFVYILIYEMESVSNWQEFKGVNNENNEVGLIYFGAAAAVLFSLVAQIGEQVDFLRFLPEKNKDNRIRWWLALMSAGPGWVIVGVIKIFAGSLLAVLAFDQGNSIENSADPTVMYAIAFQNLVNNPQAALIISGIFVILSQLKINVTNAYAGSIAWSNFFSRLTHSHPGRVVWLVFNVIIALMLMEIGVYQVFEQTLGAYAIVAVSWVSCLVADLVINKPLKLSPKHIEFRRAYLYDINPVGVGSMILASMIGIFFYMGLFGEYLKAIAHFITISVAVVCVPGIALLTRSKYYIARKQELLITDTVSEIQCCVCQNHFEREDMAMCPAYDGPICSLCCSLDARCQDMCKTTKTLTEQVLVLLQDFLPKKVLDSINGQIIRFGFLVSMTCCIVGILLLLSYVSAKTGNIKTDESMASLIWTVFLILTIVIGVISWLFVLAHESRNVAHEESQRQNKLLLKEIQAHEKTDKQLQKAKEFAEAANNAKSRYVTGISHELRTPLNAILGYAQLLEADEGLSLSRKNKVSVIKRSSEHLADLIEGLLDISKIEAGRLDIFRDQVRIAALLDQIITMFQLQALDKGLKFKYHCVNPLPECVTVDEKRLRQILINLLSNAIKYTEHGEVNFTVSYKNQVAKFEIKDSGIGIPEDEIERIFKPFERVRRPGVPAVNGTGLGLTITQLLTEIMGGEIQIKNNPEGGVTFTVWLLLSSVVNPNPEIIKPQKVYGYYGAKKTIMVVDDDPTHRGLISDLLTPLGFIVLEAPSGSACLSIFDECQPDLCLLDLSMPDYDGWRVAEVLRQRKYQQSIIIISANANEKDLVSKQTNLINDFMAKPIKLEPLLDKLANCLTIQWRYKPVKQVILDNNPVSPIPIEEDDVLETLIALAEVGHVSELKRSIDSWEQQGHLTESYAEKLRLWLSEMRFDKILGSVKGANHVS